MSIQFVRFRPELITEKAEEALAQLGEQLASEAQKQIGKVQFDWPNPTLRFTSLLMGGLAGGQRGNRFSPPTTKAGAANTKKFKSGVQQGRFAGRGIYIAEGLRDAVDTGELLRSQTPPTVTRGNGKVVMTIEWTAPYSGLVLAGGNYGMYVNPDGALVDAGVKPGRNWIAKTFEAFPAGEVFANIWRGGA